ncbi:hypothetical protein TSUD_320070 [Trifolium subterraneum]|uniref:CCHC-type domain-containing protein n=1 Tax=Trifolium subterraneum TaxID=3900 RepID=A0A2Z6NRM9_TRISU|nr:hypothetical protein TSUD_320070 [Trifolium subterraneum]
MQRKYQGSTRVKRAHLQALRREFEALAMKEDESVNDYFARTLAIANKMSAHGETLNHVTIVEKILRSMTPKFNYVVCSIEQSNDVTTLSIDELQSILIVQEQRMKNQRDIGEEKALQITNPGRGGGRRRGRNFNNGARVRGRGRHNKENVECFKCHKLGHYQNECPNWEGNDANYVEFNQHKKVLLMAKTKHDPNNKHEIWFLDSGCSNHMIGHKDWLFNFGETYSDFVKLGDGSSMAVRGKGNVKLCINGVVHVISNVYFVPGLKTNLLSIGQLQQKQITVVFKNDMCMVYHDDRGLLFTIEMTNNRMYTVTTQLISPMCLMTNKQESTLQWNNRYAHLGFKGLNTLSKKEMVKGLPEFEEMDGSCVDFLSGKQHKGEDRQSTLTLRYLTGDREESGCVEPKGNHGGLVGYVSIVAEKVQDLEKIFREAIESNLDQTVELVGLLEVVGCKGSLMLQLVELRKIPRWVRSQSILREDRGQSEGRRVVKLDELSKKAGDNGAQAFLQEGIEVITLESQEEAVSLVATKNPMVVGGKIFMRAEGIPRDEGKEVILAGSKWRLVPRSRFKWDLVGDLE